MSVSFKKLAQGLDLVPKTTSTAANAGEIDFNTTNNKFTAHNGTTASPMVTEAHTATLTNKTLSGNTATNLVSGSGTLTLNTTGTVTLPNATDTLVGKATTDTLTNKTLTTPVISSISNTGTLTLPTSTDTLVGRATTDTLTNKTLSGNTAVSLISGSGTFILNTAGVLTLPNATDTVVARQTTDTLQNKTMSGANNTFSNISLTASVTGTLPIGNGGTNSTATATAGGIGYGTGTAHAYTAAGSSGQWLKSAGTGTPVWSTATLSDTPTANTFHTGDGTNWITSTLKLTNSATANQIVYATATNTLGAGSSTFTFDGTELKVNTTAARNNSVINVDFNNAGASATGIGINDTSATNGSSFMAFMTTAGTVRGSITYNSGGPGVAFNTTSDKRLKENIIDMPATLTKVLNLRPVYYTAKESGLHGEGFIADEVQTVFPFVVTGDKDAVDKDGNPIYQQIDQSRLVPYLVKAIQELTARLERLEKLA